MKNVLIIVKYLVLMGFLIIIFIEIDIIIFGIKSKPSKSDCIIVLGCQVKGKSPSLFLQERLNDGIRLYKEGYGKYILVSGGKGAGEDITEASAMKKFFLGEGIDKIK
jgi:vancomycin permeability regulator SanA